MSRGSVEEKLTLMFDVVDTDGDGLMNINEFKTFIHAVRLPR